MPSEQQPAGKSRYKSVYERAFSDEIDLPPGPLIDGIHNEQQAIACHRAAHEFDATPDQKEKIAMRLSQYRD